MSEADAVVLDSVRFTLTNIVILNPFYRLDN